jgi:flagellar biosynthesis chaperone FliJ
MPSSYLDNQSRTRILLAINRMAKAVEKSEIDLDRCEAEVAEISEELRVMRQRRADYRRA